MQNVRMRDVAERLGMSPTTVSLVLKNHPRISSSTKEKVLQACDEMGYRPDPVAQTLARKASRPDGSRFLGTLAVLEDEDRNRITKNHSRRKIWDQQLEETCRKMGYQVNRFVVGDTEREQQSLSRILQARGIRGVVVYGWNHEVKRWALCWEELACVAYSCSLHEHFIHNVMSSSYQDVYDAVIRLQAMGYRRLGYYMDDAAFDYWAAGFSSASSTWPRQIKTDRLVVDESCPPKIREEKFLKWFERCRPEVLVTRYNPSVLEILERKGIRIPQDLGIFCLDVWDEIKHFSGLIQPRNAANQVMIDLLHGMLVRNEFGPPEKPFCIQIPCGWNQGETLKSV